jgi:HEAT repeat protein
LVSKELSGTALKKKALDLLRSPEFEKELESLRGLPIRRVLPPILSFLSSQDEVVKWHAVTATGILIAVLAEKDREGAGDILRRLLWSLNEESGSIGWGVPEAMGEILARHEGLAREFAPLLVSYIRQDGNFLEFEPLQRGVLWGLGRLAEARPHLLQSSETVHHLLPFLNSGDPFVRGHAAWALGRIGEKEGLSRLPSLFEDEAEIRIYQGREIRVVRVSRLAREAWEELRRRQRS